jgi:hypothetical protein
MIHLFRLAASRFAVLAVLQIAVAAGLVRTCGGLIGARSALFAASATMAALSAFAASFGCEPTILRKATLRRRDALSTLACDFALFRCIH